MCLDELTSPGEKNALGLKMALHNILRSTMLAILSYQPRWLAFRVPKRTTDNKVDALLCSIDVATLQPKGTRVPALNAIIQ